MASKILSFAEQNGKIGYNPTIPFKIGGKKYIGIRVESLESQLDSRILFAYEQNKSSNLWKIDPTLGSLKLQDPAYFELNGKRTHNALWG